MTKTKGNIARKQFRRGRVEKKDLHKINEKISAPFVRIVGDVESKIISIKEALHKASQMNLDLVEISP
ncbi:MAG: translation initiation factor IF-3, partial [Flavobacteriales bacterium]|nr:translation initiation factor IF-3 [Flavobacteriales bacterium]